MRTRREQVQAYRFVTRRIVSALLSGEPETNDLPMRRLGLAVFGSVMVAAIVFAGAGVYGLVTKRRAPLDTGTLVIERETGARYVYVDGRLHPALNYASARLILDESDPPVRTMSQASIRDIPRGRTVGIVDAPDALPERASLLGLPWSVCNTPDAADPSRPTTRVVIHQELAGGSALGGQAVLVRSGDTRYLLWNNLRMRLIGGEPAIAALGMAGARPLVVGPQLINAIPAGPNLQAPFISGDGEPSRLQVARGPAWIGQIFRAADQHYVLTRNGLVPISEINARLLRTDGGGVKEITPEQAGSVRSPDRLEPEGFPQKLPELRPVLATRASICATYRVGADAGPLTTTIELFDRTPAELSPSAAESVEVRQTERDRVRTVERVVVPGGRGVVAQAMPGAGEGDAGAAGSTVYLITDQGIRYPLGTRSGDALSALGYGGVGPLAVPGPVLALIPTGPTLDKAAAQQFFDPAAGSSAPAAAPPGNSGAAESGAPAAPGGPTPGSGG